ncbi:TraR/DksA family transcriptional regulator [Corallococcus llansteffanensis]|uniref:TraR/DksA family transcriptional regulator n=2 Tax=Corallococcus llansteffanensis TaxID=2316731 RepID=A0A3A8Q047_9BACT|nr:TraR/DksA family transcriptional regulator [Corallococcus llansteffanensis]
MIIQARQMLLCRRDALRTQRECAETAVPGGGARALSFGGDVPGARFARQERLEMEEVEAALVRIEEGRFGGCERCGGAIGRQRLLAVPEARCCLTCADRRTQGAGC